MPRATTSIRITREAHEKLQDMADADGISLIDEIDRIVEEQRRQRLFNQADRAYAALQEDERAWNEMQQERKELKGTLANGLEGLDE